MIGVPGDEDVVAGVADDAVGAASADQEVAAAAAEQIVVAGAADRTLGVAGVEVIVAACAEIQAGRATLPATWTVSSPAPATIRTPGANEHAEGRAVRVTEYEPAEPTGLTRDRVVAGGTVDQDCVAAVATGSGAARRRERRR